VILKDILPCSSATFENHGNYVYFKCVIKKLLNSKSLKKT